MQIFGCVCAKLSRDARSISRLSGQSGSLFLGAERHRYFLPTPKILCKRKKAPSSITAERWLFQLAQMSSFFCERLTIQNQPISLCKHKVVMFAPVYISRAVTHINIHSIPLLGIVRPPFIPVPCSQLHPVEHRYSSDRLFPGLFPAQPRLLLLFHEFVPKRLYFVQFFLRGGFLLRSSLSSASLFGESQSIWKSSSIYSSCVNPFTSILYRVGFSRCQNRCLA